MKPYLLNDEPVDGRQLIKIAQSVGYEESSRIYITSKAAEFLRKKGFNVTENTEEK